MSKQKILTASAMAALCALAALSLQAKAQDGTHDGDAGPGMVVVRDAQTGKMRAPTADELKALRAKAPPTAAMGTGAARQQAHALATRPDGARGVRLGEKTMVYEVVTRGADGTLSSHCVQGDAAAAQALGSDTVPHKEHAHEAR